MAQAQSQIESKNAVFWGVLVEMRLKKFSQESIKMGPFSRNGKGFLDLP
jgi:hypothetical protein